LQFQGEVDEKFLDTNIGYFGTLLIVIRDRISQKWMTPIIVIDL